ncbi:Fe-S cluster assembly ATPase SufC [Iningainema tapete]|uniref:Fe-S cluster assembly ATPase SufC n=1 Tax=Iningainema tapete BLCC-T55 TaxID=2748662 RepID=A0A8J7BYW0_9CYAN|nr:Fe-S cluster assembly ATPase SufC [Iningainema tapete]MBD2774723.1 Fe-S cluster assembly ATPase SufC [Iningainema tapete BLCC-T55]
MIVENSDLVLSVRDLTADVDGTPILKGLNLEVRLGEVHAIMGPNGSGKSTFSKVLAGHPAYEVTGGEVIFQGQNLLEMEPEERARSGVFLAFQYPLEIPGVSNLDFLRVAYNSRRKAQGLEELDAFDFDDLVEQKLEVVKMNPAFLSRSVNEGFSGGEKKRNEILQMALLEPKLAILDETDSGLDIDALKIVAQGVNQLTSPENATIMITHYQRLLNYIVPDYVHVMAQGRIITSGGKELALELESRGYDWILDEAGVGV